METDYKMDPELKQKWVDALRSGKYKQGNGWLRDEKDRYCCLGVLADVMATEWKLIHGVYRASICMDETDLNDDILPQEVREELIDMNDGQDRATNPVPRRRFTTIARWIEENL